MTEPRASPALLPLVRSIRTRVALAAAVVFALAIGSGFAFALLLETQRQSQDHEERLDLIATSLKSALTAVMLRARPADLQATLSDFGTHDTGRTAEVLDPQMRVVASSEPRRIGLTQAVALSADPFTSRMEPIANEPECQACHSPKEPILGYLHVSQSPALLKARVAQLRNTLVASAVMALGLMLAVSWFVLSRLVVMPIRELANSMRRAQAGDLSVRVLERRPVDELTWLAQSFNHMIARLAETRSDLERSYREGLLRADRLATIGELASGLAHEIRNPLAGLSGAVQVLSDEFGAQPDRRELLAEMQRQIDRLGRAMNDLLSLARPTAPHLAPTDLNVVIEHVVALLKKHLGARTVVFETHLAATQRVAADAPQLEQVFLNLGINALQAMPSGGTLGLRSYDDDAEVVVEVTDTGEGIAPEAQANLFKPFFTTKPRGTGLGLAISQRIITKHNGTIGCDNPNGGGARFVVRLPQLGSRSSDSPAHDGGDRRIV